MKTARVSLRLPIYKESKMQKLFIIMLTLLCACPFLNGGSDKELGEQLVAQIREYRERFYRNAPRDVDQAEREKTAALKQITELIKQGADVNVHDADGDTCLYYVSQLPCDPRYDQLLKDLKQAGADASTINKNYRSSIFDHAQEKCHITRVLDAGFKPAPDDVRALEQSVFEREPGRLDLLLNAGINPATPSWENRTVLMLAADQNYYDATTSILSHHAKIDQEDSDGLTALHFAFKGIGMKLNTVFAREKYQIIQKLVQSGAQINHKDKEGATPLIYAVKEHDAYDEAPDQKLIDLVISSGADPLQKDKHGLSALHYASHKRLNVLIQSIFSALYKYAPEKIDAAQKEIHMPLEDVLERTAFMQRMTDSVYSAGNFAKQVIAAYGVYKTAVAIKSYLKRN